MAHFRSIIEVIKTQGRYTMYYLGIDLGGTNIAAGIVDENYKIIKKKSVPTLAHRDGKEIIKDMAKLCLSLIEDCGLKGLSVGGAQVSEKHAGFIINRGGATYSDVLALEEKIKERVLDRFGVLLCREVRLIED